MDDPDYKRYIYKYEKPKPKVKCKICNLELLINNLKRHMNLKHLKNI